MPDSNGRNRRAFFRLRYPDADRPVLTTGPHRFEVAEVSEAGGRLVLVGTEPGVGTAVSGPVSFADAPEWIEGTVLRHDAGEAVVVLTVRVTLRRMLTEQKRLARRYPARTALGTGEGPTEPHPVG
ncbi:Uncharacterized protein OS=Vibrio caribbenthicus ATCC BAA-2122 GN=VIBC2010_12544 PE=4 SV=1 [Gemmataceae bacterium]|nr:Uncharacterized protein OS=Vibrio caribbenthicus ATCC BAA-2122 GN=VIBC2010_12544 PE=4 SV=1 [Gemmataceae bacterium]VTT97875.1 Uncharacterized protein OS=Vibrio caribbenthicus ATCC BAA-2122 GN=VIBC2010_12544 PE=4 SV=1 [Gemmataceae bacterium]